MLDCSLSYSSSIQNPAHSRPQHVPTLTTHPNPLLHTSHRSIADLTAALSAAGSSKLEAQQQVATLRQRVAALEAELTGRRVALAEALDARQRADDVESAARRTFKSAASKALELRNGGKVRGGWPGSAGCEGACACLAACVLQCAAARCSAVLVAA